MLKSSSFATNLEPCRPLPFFLAAVVAGCGGAASRDPGFLSDVGSCDACSLRAVEYWSTPPRDPNVLEAGIFLEAGSELWAMGGFADEQISVFGLTEPTSRNYLRRGDGPGEFADQVMGAALHSSGDTLIIAQAGKIESFTFDLGFLRGFRPAIEVRGTLEAMSDGTLVLTNSVVPRLESARGMALHVLSDSGQHIRSMRPIDAANRPFVPLRKASEPNSVWIGIPTATGFELEQWDVVAGTQIRAHRFAFDWWYEPSVADLRALEAEEMAGNAQPRPEDLRPSSGLVGIHDDGSLVWLTVRHSDEDYASEVILDSPRPSRLFDTVLMAVDRTSGSILQAMAIDEFSYGFTNEGALVAVGLDEDEFPFFSLRHPELDR